LSYGTGAPFNALGLSPVVTGDISPYQFADDEATERLVNDLHNVRQQELDNLRVETAPSFKGFGNFLYNGVTNKRTTMIGKIMSILTSPNYAFAHFMRSPTYHPLQDTIISPWNNLGVTSHELGHAIDFNSAYVEPEESRLGNLGSKIKRDAYAVAGGIPNPAMPIVNIIQEVRAWRAAKEALKDSYKTDDAQLTDEDREKLNKQFATAKDPALSTYLTGGLSAYVPANAPLILPALLGTAFLNPRKQQLIEELNAAAKKPEEEDTKKAESKISLQDVKRLVDEYKSLTNNHFYPYFDEWWPQTVKLPDGREERAYPKAHLPEAWNTLNDAEKRKGLENLTKLVKAARKPEEEDVKKK